ncbi:uncharacterized protein LOC112094031 [Morus notabilis]|uniref:uncharacterized protein LOC112094031 n=1 Tax=Morus notabilis TaxID=981085 RepID=UPI000CED34AC|nr:uncharacterized protein LOC112094031 [Morus notabilis]
MDFGTISTKLSGGSYKTLAEFEHDVFLVSSNAMLFNSSSTVYYRHARAIKDLAQKLFDALKTNPKNFEKECSILRQRAGRRTKNGSCDQPTKRVVSEGSREERPYQHSEDRLGNCKPWETFLNENEAIISSVYKSPESINPKLKTKMDEVGYEGSLMRFVKDLGPTPQTVARDKLQKWKADEAFKRQIVTAHLEPLKSLMSHLDTMVFPLLCL